ncbi:MAG: hypothetical protein NC313_04070 [Butyrivibrio sp.]|nr:hypothetical protein [Butyrivibrio sp.]
MDKNVENLYKSNKSGQVSDKSQNNVEDASFVCIKEEREKRMLRFEQLMSGEEFIKFKEALTLFDDEQDVMGKSFEDHLEQYFDTLIGFMEIAFDRQNRNTEKGLLYSQVVEELYLINCEKIRKDNSYNIYSNHPILLIDKRLSNEMDNMVTDKKRRIRTQGNEETQESVDCEIIKSVFDAKKKNRRRMRLYSRNMVYEVKGETADVEKGFVNARIFNQSDECTEVPIIRIWEKVRNYKELYQVNPKLINIAVFGSLKEYSDDEKEVVEELTGTKLNCISFQHEPMMGEYFFRSNTGTEVYDLMDMNDLQMLTENYQIVLLLDLNCFYRQAQSKKEVEEKSPDTTCRWNFKRSQRCERFIDKAAIYRTIYNRIGKWINMPDSDMSAYFEFDERLYRNFVVLPEKKADIYLYLRYGANIGECNLDNNGICNDEYYDGLPLTVCRISKMDKEQFNEDYGKFINNDNNAEKEPYVSIRFWKLLKSISNEYCDAILRKFGEGDTRKTKDIVYFLNESYLVLYYTIHSVEEKVSIRYNLESSGNISLDKFPALQKAMLYIAKDILRYAFGEEEMYCMNNYFERLLIHSVISNSDDMGDLVFAYWIASHWYTVEGQIKEEQDETQIINKNNAFLNSRNRFKVRKTIYSMLRQLADMRMRGTSDMRSHFSASFHGEVCPEVTEDNLDRTYQSICTYCIGLNYTDGYLYMNSRLLMDK